MLTVNVTTESRTKMARTLARFLKDHLNIDIKHTHAIQAIAAMLGFNEHSLAAAVAGGPTSGEAPPSDAADPPARPMCAVSGCTAHADFEVRLYDFYVNDPWPQVFDKRDYTCPHLCADHARDNERRAKGKRQPRGSVEYPYSNQHFAQGFTIYRELPNRDPES